MKREIVTEQFLRNMAIYVKIVIFYHFGAPISTYRKCRPPNSCQSCRTYSKGVICMKREKVTEQFLRNMPIYVKICIFTPFGAPI